MTNFQRNSKNMKQLRSGITSVISVRKSNNKDVVRRLKDSNGYLTLDLVVIAKISNEFFVNVSHCITKNIPRRKNHPKISWVTKLEVFFH